MLLSLNASNLCNIFHLEALVGLSNIEFDSSALFQGAVAFAANLAKMNEYIFPRISLDKSKTLGVIEPFYGSRLSLGH